MSAGAEHKTPSRLAHGGGVEVLMRSGGAPGLMRRWQSVDFDHDIPYGAGYNVAGTIVYLDRDLVRAIFDPEEARKLVGEPIDTGLSPHDTLACIWRHEQVEKVLFDSDNPIDGYKIRHDYATAAEHDMVREKGSTPIQYERGLAKIFAYCAKKPLKQAPRDLSAAAAMDDKAVLAKLKKAGVEDADRVSRESVNYGKARGPEHCAACSMWQGQANSPLAQCSLVEGLVRADRTCDEFNPSDLKSERSSGGRSENKNPPNTVHAALQKEENSPKSGETGGLTATSKTPTSQSLTGGRPVQDPKIGTLAQRAHSQKSGNVTDELSQKPRNSSATRDVLLARHGATKLNNEDNSVDRIRGHADIPLSSEGIAEAHRLAKKIAKDPPDVIVSSDLKRAADTAKIIADACGMKVSEIIEGLRPWKLGYVTGMLTKKAIPIMADFINNKPDERVPGGNGEPEGQSFNEFLRTYFDTVLDILEKYEGRILFVAHHRNERAMHAWEAAGFPPDGSVDTDVFNKKGEAPGTVCPMKIPVEALEKFERSTKGKSDGESQKGNPQAREEGISENG